MIVISNALDFSNIACSDSAWQNIQQCTIYASNSAPTDTFHN